MNPDIEFVEKNLENLIELMTKDFVDALPVQTDPQPETPQAKFERIKIHLEDMFKDLDIHMQHGWLCLFDELKESDIDSFDDLITRLNFTSDSRQRFMESGPNQVGEVDVPAFIRFGISSYLFEKLYQSASRLLGQEKFPDAADAFLVLVILDPNNYWNWMGFGLAKQWENRDLKDALTAFTIATTLQNNEPLPFLHIAECLAALKEKEEAASFIKIASDMAGNEERYQLLRERCEALRGDLI